VKAIVVITDSEAVRDFEKGCLAAPGRGFTVIPRVWGAGRSGVRTGDRIHPGGSSLLFTVVPDTEVDSAVECLKGCRDRAGVEDATNIYVAPVEEIA
jgi:nitrogen regulatory protein PII